MPSGKTPPRDSLCVISREIADCAKCSRLVAWREKIAREKVRRFADQEYWGRAVPGFGDPHARLFVVGLAPAGNGGNRTGRIFTGDTSGDFLYRALYKAGYANQPISVSRDDGLLLHDCYIAAVARCAPPDNKPSKEEIETCRPYLVRELRELTHLKICVALGKVAYDGLFDAMNEAYGELPRAAPFSHGAAIALPSGRFLLASYHPSQRNTRTGLLTEKMFDAIFAKARQIIDHCPPVRDVDADRIVTVP